MKTTVKFISFLILFSSSYFTYSQTTTDNSNTVEWYIQNVLVGNGVTVSNVTINGAPGNTAFEQVGQFTSVNSDIGLANGLIMGTGDINLATSNNLDGDVSLGGDPSSSAYDADLLAISASSEMFDQCIIEFDFVPVGPDLNFNYIFASEEYNEYVCSEFNDAFGFFLSGPNPAGGNYVAQNIALIPDPLSPGNYTTTAVSINTVNNGSAGGTYPTSGCSNLDPNWTSYTPFFNFNNVNTYEYDGRTVSLPVDVDVVCGETYHIKLAIGDAVDNGWDSGVMFQTGSFVSNELVAEPIELTDLVMCTSPPFDVDFDANSNTVPPYAIWHFGDGNDTGIIPNNETPTHTYATEGTYTIMYVAIDSNTCLIADTAEFVLNITEKEVFDAQIDIPAFDPCAGAIGLTIDLEFTGTGADSLSWDMGNGDVYSDSLDWAYTYNSTGTFTIEMIAYDLVCNHTDTIRQVVDYNPNVTTAQATPLGDITLCGQPYDINFPASPNPAVHEEWVFGDTIGGVIQTTGITLAGASPTHTYADTGSFEVTYYAIDSSTCNIIDSTKFTVTLIQPEQFSAQIDIPPYDPCNSPNGLTLDLEFTGTGADSLVWNMGSTGDVYSDSLDWSYTYLNTGTYTITMTAYDFVCNNVETITETVDYFLNTTVANATPPGNIFLCDPPYDVPFVLSGPDPQYSNWDYGDGSISGVGNTHGHTYTYADTGTYEVTYYAIDSNSCNIIDSAEFTVVLSQSETFNATLDFVPPPVCGSDTAFVNMEFTGSGADILIWDMGDGTTFNTNQVNYFYTDPGTYTITMYAEDTQCNKSQTISKTVNFVGNVNSEVIVPNVFTPNGDGQNDEIIFSGVDENAEFSWMIFNRWGTKIFETTSQNDPWKGGKGVDGKDLKPGLYYYELIYRDACKEEDNIKTGHITLMR